MKKKLLILVAVALGALSSCSQNQELQTIDNANLESVTFEVLTEEVETKRMPSKRYIMEVYAENGETVVNCFENGTTNRSVLSEGKFTADLDKSETYTILFWSDTYTGTGEDTFYDATSLKNISLNSGQKMSSEAYFFKMTDLVGETQTITLDRAVARIDYLQAGVYNSTSGEASLEVTYENTYTFNCLTGAITASGNAISRTFVGEKLEISDGGKLGTDYHFAPAINTDADGNVTGGTTINLKANFSTDYETTQKSIASVPIKANTIIVIKGQYSTDAQKSEFIIKTSDAEWGTDSYEIF